MLLGAGVSSGFLPLKPHSLTPPGVRKPPFPEVQGSWTTWAGQEPRVELCLTAGSEDGVMRRCPRELPPLLFSSEFPGFSHSLGYPAAAGWPPPCSLGKGGEMETLCQGGCRVSIPDTRCSHPGRSPISSSAVRHRGHPQSRSAAGRAAAPKGGLPESCGRGRSPSPPS